MMNQTKAFGRDTLAMLYKKIPEMHLILERGPATPPTPTRSGYHPEIWNGMDWKALVKLGPPNIGKLIV